ncbi:kinase-like protein [Rhizophagus irregularis]|uniref:Kinase-like protein n=2 Tax=Rhizophagus irregularis TaxID=588596 RepID=A0A2N0R624_9GLOM|nr:kinase-like protein [Rhizophagus irregularis]
MPLFNDEENKRIRYHMKIKSPGKHKIEEKKQESRTEQNYIVYIPMCNFPISKNYYTASIADSHFCHNTNRDLTILIMDDLKTKDKIKKIFSKDLREQIENFGICSDCKEANTGYAWCKKCDPGRFLREGKTSGNIEMNEFIYDSQRQTLHYYDNLEWIPFNKFDNINPIGEGGFSIIYSATWREGAPKYDKEKARTGPISVALKKLKNSDMKAFINEIRIHDECNYANFHITQLYGITKDPDTEEFMMVLEYANYGNLRDYFKKYYSNLRWEDKLVILLNIIHNLDFIHERNYVHKDLHSGNILQFFYNDWIDTKIADLGCAQQLDNSNSPNSITVCGVLPYIAPEVLCGKHYTFASDIYSFGIIMVEVSTGKPPYGNVPHDEKLVLAICSGGLRPNVGKGTPYCYIDLVNQCLDSNPDKRPTSKEILQKIRNWRFYDDPTHSRNSLFSKKTKDIKMYKEFIDTNFQNADKNFPQRETTLTLHPGATYVSRIMSFNNNNEPKNSKGIQIEDPEAEVPDSQLVDLFVE